MNNEKVSILLSIYKPNKVFLKKQLRSLNSQTYENLELIVWNDCPNERVDTDIFESEITNFPCKIYDEHVNLGYIKAFEKLVTLANGEYICFCDQDDIWENSKIEECISALKAEDATVAVCDQSIIDENDTVTLESVRNSSKLSSKTWKTDDDITARALFICYSPGMSMHARKSDVERCIPFVDETAHDRQLMAFLSAMGKAVFVEKPLIRYRRYGANETGTLNGVDSKKEYYLKRCNNTELLRRFGELFPDRKDIDALKYCNEVRMSGNPFKLIKCKDMIPDLFKYEFLLAFCPDFVFKILSKLLFKR